MDDVNGLSGPKDEARPNEGAAWATAPLDVTKYLPQLAGIDATDTEKIELLETLCAILRACIDLQLSGDSYIELIDALENASQESGSSLSSGDQQQDTNGI